MARYPVNIGKRTPMNVDVVPGGVALRDTQLITQDFPSPEQWVITLGQAVKQGTARGGVTPWQQNWDGTAVALPIVAPAYFNAPAFPWSGSALQVALRWGAGGTSFETRFDYPVNGCAFGLLADSVNVDVVVRGAPAPADTPTLADVPVIGAFMVPGIAADPTPLRWRDVDSGLLNSAATAIARWSVKPYARRVRVEFQGPAANTFILFTDTAGVVLSQYVNTAPGFYIVDVPAQATLLEVNNNSAVNIAARVEWYIGLT